MMQVMYERIRKWNTFCFCSQNGIFSYSMHYTFYCGLLRLFPNEMCDIFPIFAQHRHGHVSLLV